MRLSSFRKALVVALVGQPIAIDVGVGGSAQPSLRLTCAMVGSCFSEGDDDAACKRFGATNGNYLILISEDKQEAAITSPAAVVIRLPFQCFNGVCKGRSSLDGAVRNLSLVKSTNQAVYSETYFVSKRRYKLIKLFSGSCR